MEARAHGRHAEAGRGLWRGNGRASSTAAPHFGTFPTLAQPSPLGVLRTRPHAHPVLHSAYALAWLVRKQVMDDARALAESGQRARSEVLETRLAQVYLSLFFPFLAFRCTNFFSR